MSVYDIEAKGRIMQENNSKEYNLTCSNTDRRKPMRSILPVPGRAWNQATERILITMVTMIS